MKRYISLIIALCLVLACPLSLWSCGNEGGGDADGTGTGGNVGGDTVKYADPGEVLGKYRANGFFESAMLSSEVSVYNVSTNFAIYSVLGTFKKDASGNVYREKATDSASVTDCEYVIGSTYYKGTHPASVSRDAAGITVSLSDSEKAEIAKSLSPNFLKEDLTLLFNDVKCVEDSDRYTVLCHSEDQNVISRFTDFITADLSDAFAEGSEFSFVSVDYQLILNCEGAPIAYAVASAFLVVTDDIIEEGSLENYYSYVYVAAVSDCTETLTPPDFTSSDVTVTEKTYAEVFGK